MSWRLQDGGRGNVCPRGLAGNSVRVVCSGIVLYPRNPEMLSFYTQFDHNVIAGFGL